MGVRGIRFRSALLALAAAAAAWFAPAVARADYPERQVTMVVCFPAAAAPTSRHG